MTKDERHLLEEKYGGDELAAGFAEDCARLAAGEPVAYVIGAQPFLGLKILLDSKPLIPRPETEWWTEQLLTSLLSSQGSHAVSETLRRATARAGGNSPAGEYSVLRNLMAAGGTFLDLCAGSGAIGCAALARLPHARVTFAELDRAHEATIMKNIRENGLDAARADIRIGDLFAPLQSERFDVIAINPPYIPETRALDASVSDFEPHSALFSGKDGLDLIRRIAQELPEHLNPSGVAWVECDRDTIESAKGIFETGGLAARVIPDQYEAPRVVVVSLP